MSCSNRNSQPDGSFLHAQGLGVEYKTGMTRLTAIEDFSLHLHRREVVSIVGPSGCGKTGTAMTGNALIGDDLAKIFIDKASGEVRAVNPEKGMFGIIEGMKRQDDPETMDVLEGEGQEVIFSNLLVHEQKPYWQGCDYELPETGRNFTGAWARSSGRPL
ncbi:MAG: phosphoenolpyruvate carboxykinase (GTP) [Candidatus Electrothrix sp. AR3]|nr:phosphoenolpyruvate carboxykinase (GTP) [Candidatus Electrothrix sp. AR3]